MKSLGVGQAAGLSLQERSGKGNVPMKAVVGLGEGLMPGRRGQALASVCFHEFAAINYLSLAPAKQRQSVSRLLQLVPRFRRSGNGSLKGPAPDDRRWCRSTTRGTRLFVTVIPALVGNGRP